MLLNPRTSYSVPGPESSILLLTTGTMAELTVGQRIAEQRRRISTRREKRYTQTDLAAAVGVSKSTVAAWETDAQTPSGDNLVKVARALQTTPEHLLRGNVSDNLEQATEWVATAEGTVRFLGGIAPAGEQQEIKKDILELMRRAWQEMGSGTPEWWYALRGRVETGEL